MKKNVGSQFIYFAICQLNVQRTRVMQFSCNYFYSRMFIELVDNNIFRKFLFLINIIKVSYVLYEKKYLFNQSFVLKINITRQRLSSILSKNNDSAINNNLTNEPLHEYVCTGMYVSPRICIVFFLAYLNVSIKEMEWFNSQKMLFKMLNGQKISKKNTSCFFFKSYLNILLTFAFLFLLYIMLTLGPIILVL